MSLADRLRPWFVPLLLSSQLACLDHLFEAPLILTTGLGTIVGLAPTPHDSLLVATDAGLWEVQADGTKRRLTNEPVRDVSTHPDRLILLGDDWMSWAAYPTENETLTLSQRIPVPGVSRTQAWFDEQVWITRDERIIGVDLETGERSELYSLPSPILDLSLGNRRGERSALVSLRDSLYLVENSGIEAIHSSSPLHAAVMDREERLWFVSEQPIHLSIRSGTTQTLVSDVIERPSAMTMGSGGLMPEDALFMATPDGRIEYIRSPFR